MPNNKKRTLSVYMGATAGVSVLVEADKGTPMEQIVNTAYDKASLSDVQGADWDGLIEVIEDGEVVFSEDTGEDMVVEQMRKELQSAIDLMRKFKIDNNEEVKVFIDRNTKDLK